MKKALDVINAWEEQLQVVEELISLLRQVLVHHQLQKVSEVIGSVVTNPMNSVIQYQSRGCHFFCEI